LTKYLTEYSVKREEEIGVSKEGVIRKPIVSEMMSFTHQALICKHKFAMLDKI